MSDKTTEPTTASEAASQVAEAAELNPEAGLAGAASFADAEAREILNLLGGNDGDSADGCCGGGCCSV